MHESASIDKFRVCVNGRHSPESANIKHRPSPGGDRKRELTKAVSERKLLANRENSKKSCGPCDTRRTRYNAVKFGLLTKSVSDLDLSEGYRAVLHQFVEEKRPQGEREIFLVGQIALYVIRLRRVRCLQLEHVKNHTLRTGCDAASPNPFSYVEIAQPLVRIFLRHETALLKAFCRAQHELDRLQRIRGEIGLVRAVEQDISPIEDRMEATQRAFRNAATAQSDAAAGYVVQQSLDLNAPVPSVALSATSLCFRQTEGCSQFEALRPNDHAPPVPVYCAVLFPR
jgi:hypothetical protein